MAQGFGKVNTFPVRMALRTALANMGLERYADIVRAFDTKDDYFRRVLLESFTRHNGIPEYLPVVCLADARRGARVAIRPQQGCRVEH
jgi:hypothetical protein